MKKTELGNIVDPVTLSVTWSKLISIADEMGAALRQTAFSEAVREGEDFSTGIFDGQARLIAQGNFTPGHLGAMPYVVKHILRFYPPEKLEDGDAIFTNDSFLGSSHFPDFFVMSPVFKGKNIVAYVVNSAHHVDVGGAYPGSQAVQGVSEAYNEGVRVLPIKFSSKGKMNKEIMRLLLGNVRLPEKMTGDFHAQINANNVGSERLLNFFDEITLSDFQNTVDAILNHSECRARELISALPNGRFSFDDNLDDYGPGTPPIRVCVDIDINEDTAVLDFSRSSDQVPAGMNCYINYTRAYGMFAMRVIAGFDIPHNAGVEKVIKIVAREGCFFNAVHPAASGGRASVQVRIFDAVNGAMAQAVPDQVRGAFSHWSNPNIASRDGSKGKWLMYDLIFGGYGGRNNSDGTEGLSPVMNCANIPVEVHEAANPVLIHCLEYIVDSAGAGHYRGGCGVRKDIEIRDKAVVTLLSDRHTFAPYGVHGGQSGKCARTLLIRDGKTIDLGSKQVVELEVGDRLSFQLAGAGGYGPVEERSQTLVEADIRNGYISKDSARVLYQSKSH